MADHEFKQDPEVTEWLNSHYQVDTNTPEFLEALKKAAQERAVKLRGAKAQYEELMAGSAERQKAAQEKHRQIQAEILAKGKRTKPRPTREEYEAEIAKGREILSRRFRRDPEQK